MGNFVEAYHQNVITNWRDLKVGMHVRLSCGCEGYVAEVRTEGDSNEGNIGFLLQDTKGHCGRMSRWGYRNSYSKGYGPYGNFFNYGSEEDACPITIVPVPKWWAKFEDGPDRKIKNLIEERWRKYKESQKNETKP